MSLAGERVDHYRIVGVIGAGSMGHVYRAVDERLMREVAIKLLPQSDARVSERQARFLREAKAAGNLNHPGIVTIHDIGRWRERTYIVMELVEGWRLTDVAAARPLSIPTAVSLCRQAAEALAAAHERGILHRDIKPDNLMVTADGRVKILDFGVAKLFVTPPTPVPGPMPPERDVWDVVTQPGWPETSSAGNPTTPELTRIGALLGTPSYMSPEQASGRGYEARSDIYSLAVVLYEIATGVRPLVRQTLEATLAAAIKGGIPSAATVAPGRDIPRSLDGVLGRALAVRPEDRYPDMRSFALALRAVENSLAAARRARLWPIGVVVVGAAALAAGGVAVVRVGAAREATKVAAPGISVAKLRRLTFDPGCEELPAMWPDGKAIVFDGIIDGDTELVRLDIDAGARVRLTTTPGWDMAGAVSPDGRWIAYIHYGDRGRELMVMEWNGTTAGPARSLGISRGYPTWSRAGEVIYSDDRGQLFAIAPTPGAQGRLLGSLGGGVIVTQAHELPGGFLYGAHSTVTERILRVGILRPDGTSRELEGTDTIDTLGVSLDAARSGYYYGRLVPTGNQLRWRNIDGDQVEDIAGLPFPHGGLAVSPTRDRMVLSTCRQVWAIGRLLPDGRFEPFEARTDWKDSSVRWLGGDRYVAVSDRSGTSQIWTIEPGREARLLVSEPATHVDASPDRARIAWSGSDTSAGIHITEIASGASRRLTDDVRDVMPRFSRDGAAVYFLRGGPDGLRIHRIALAGGLAEPMSPPDVIGFDVSPVDDRLLWVSRGGQGRTLLVGPPGGEAQAVPELPVSEYTSPRFAPDGRKAWVVRGGTDLVEVALDGGAPPRVVWQTRNNAIGQVALAPDGNGWIGEVAQYEGDLHLVEGRFR